MPSTAFGVSDDAKGLKPPVLLRGRAANGLEPVDSGVGDRWGVASAAPAAENGSWPDCLRCRRVRLWSRRPESNPSGITL